VFIKRLGDECGCSAAHPSNPPENGGLRNRRGIATFRKVTANVQFCSLWQQHCRLHRASGPVGRRNKVKRTLNCSQWALEQEFSLHSKDAAVYIQLGSSWLTCSLQLLVKRARVPWLVLVLVLILVVVRSLGSTPAWFFKRTKMGCYRQPRIPAIDHPRNQGYR